MAKYCLEQVRRAAKSGKIQFHGRVASRDAAELGYAFDDICSCLTALTPEEYSKTLKYEQGPEFDVYLTKFRRPGYPEEIDELYIKFALKNNILIASFHLQRF